MQPSSAERQIAYGRIILELGLVPPDRLRTIGQACLARGIELRQALLSQGLIGPEDDAQVMALLRSRSQSQVGTGVGPTRAAPSRGAKRKSSSFGAAVGKAAGKGD